MNKKKGNINKTTKLAIALLLPVMISSCSSQKPAAVRNNGSYFYGKDGVSRFVVVYPGQTLLQIAVENNVALKDLAKINKISSPYYIYAGQHIRLPNEIYHIVKPGESLSAICSKYRVSLDSMIKVNDIAPPYHVRVGQKLRIPSTNKDSISNNTDNIDPYKDVVQESTAPIVPLKEQNDTSENGLSDAYQEDDLKDIERELKEEDKETAKGASTLKIANKSNGNSVEPSHIYKSSTPLNSDKFVWPIQEDAKVLSHYGQTPGKFKEGISIAAPLNAPVASVSKGEVIYVGNDVEGYGKMVIIRHDNDILSAYAHNSSVLVKKGDKVAKAQVIAKVGKTGDVDQPQLYFSLRKGKATINPEKPLK